VDGAAADRARNALCARKVAGFVVKLLKHLRRRR
jgi:hypothetical protein